MSNRLTVIARSARRSNPSFFLLRDGCFAEPRHRARIRATRWLAMTLIGSGYDFVLAARCARGVTFIFRPKRAWGIRAHDAPAVPWCTWVVVKKHTSNNEHTEITRHSRRNGF